MSLKTTKTIYWIGLALTTLWFSASGILELTANKAVWEITQQLGYPPHFIYLLGLAKISGVIVLLIPDKLLRLKEWVFAGLFFDIVFAYFSKLAVIGLAATADAVIAFIMVTVTYVMFTKLFRVRYNIST